MRSKAGIEDKKYGVYRTVWAISCTIFNFALALITNKLGLPIYFDSIGTILISMLSGSFTGCVVAVATNMLCTLFYTDSIYYSFIGVMIVLCAAWFIRNEKFRKKRNHFLLILQIALISGVVGSVFQWLLLGRPQFDSVAAVAEQITAPGTTLYFIVCMILILIFNIIRGSNDACKNQLRNP